jgi:hypothetical protein
MQISLSLFTSLLALFLAINAAPAVDDLHPQIKVRQNNLQARTPRPGNCMGVTCLDASGPPICDVRLYRQRVYHDGIPQGVPHPTSKELNKMAKLCKRHCKCSPGADGHKLYLTCKAEAGDDCPGLCLCPNRGRSSAARRAGSSDAGVEVANAGMAANTGNMARMSISSSGGDAGGWTAAGALRTSTTSF